MCDISVSNKRIDILIFTIIFVILFTSSCAPAEESFFPVVSYERSSSFPASQPEEKSEPENISVNLTVALPLNEECIKYLSYMRSGEENGLFRETEIGYNGKDIPLEILDTYENDFSIKILPTPVYGLSAESLETFYMSGEEPDIYLISDYSLLSNDNIKVAVYEPGYFEDYLEDGSVFPTMMSYEPITGKVRALPYHASVQMLYANQKLLNSAQNDLPSLTPPLTINILKNAAQRITDPENGIYGFFGAKEFAAYMPSAGSPFPKAYVISKGALDFQSESFVEVLGILQEFGTDGSLMDAIDVEEQSDQYGNIDPRVLGKIAFWIDDSSSVDRWLDITEVKRYPLPVMDRISLPLNVSSVVINEDTNFFDEAASLASYISLDRDAILFRSRYTNPEGFIPVLNDDLIWKSLVASQKEGEELMSLKELMTNSHSLDESAPPNAIDIFSALYDDYFHGIIIGEIPLEDDTMKMIQQEANNYG